MAFVTLQPAGYIKKQSITASFSIREKNGVGTLFVVVPGTMAGKGWDAFERVSFMLGDGEDAGLLRIEAVADADFKIGRLKHALVFRVPAQPGWTMQEFSNVIVDVVTAEASAYVIRLPRQLLEPAKPVAETPQSFFVPSPEQPSTGKTADGRRPRELSIVGSTVSHAGKSLRLNSIHFKAFSILERSWGKPVAAAIIIDALDLQPTEILTFFRIFRDKLAPLGIIITQRPAEGYVMQLSPEAVA